MTIGFSLHFPLSTVTCDKYATFPDQKQLGAQPGAVKMAVSTQLQHQRE